jgi:hypothetical protein
MIPSGAQYVTLQKYFSHPGFIYFFSCTLTDTTETETANRCETTNSKPPGRIIMIGQSETGRSSEIVFITLSFTTYSFVAPFYQPQQKCANMQERKSFS